MANDIDETLSPRERNAVVRIRSTAVKAAREYFDSDGWTEVFPHPLSNLSGACEDFSKLFQVDYFGRHAFLIHTGQQYLERIVQESFKDDKPIEKTYAITASSRAETRTPKRRLTTFFMVEGEAAYFKLSKIQVVQEQLVKQMCAAVLEERQPDLGVLPVDTDKFIALNRPFEQITYTKAIELLVEKGSDIQWGQDLKGEHEKILGEYIGCPFFVTHYPGAIKFFNMKSDPTDHRIVLSCDLLVPGYGEIAGASEREDDADNLRSKLAKFARDEERVKNLKKFGFQPQVLEAEFQWYLDLRKNPGVPTAGFGFGLERIIQWICEFDSIMMATEFPNNMYHLGP